MPFSVHLTVNFVSRFVSRHLLSFNFLFFHISLSLYCCLLDDKFSLIPFSAIFSHFIFFHLHFLTFFFFRLPSLLHIFYLQLFHHTFLIVNVLKFLSSTNFLKILHELTKGLFVWGLFLLKKVVLKGQFHELNIFKGLHIN